jgi:hypothetical protein
MALLLQPERFEPRACPRQHALDAFLGRPDRPCHLAGASLFPVPPQQHQAVPFGQLREDTACSLAGSYGINLFVESRRFCDRLLCGRIRVQRFGETKPLAVDVFDLVARNAEEPRA